jgi:hypothetical protein
MLGCAHACVRARAASRWASAELGTHPEFCPVEALCRPLVLAGEGARSSDRRSKAAIENWGKTAGDAELLDLALVQAAGFLKAADRRPLVVQVRAQLAFQLNTRPALLPRARQRPARAAGAWG